MIRIAYASDQTQPDRTAAFARLDSARLAEVVNFHRASSSQTPARRSLSDLLEHDPDAVDAVVFDESPASKQAVAQAAAAGKHLLVPLASLNSRAQVAELLSVSSARCALLMPCQTQRFEPALQAVKQSLDEEKLGEPGLLRIHCWEPAELCVKSTAENLPQREFFERLLPEVDLALWLCGGTPEMVYATQLASAPNSNGDYYQLHFGFASSAMAIIDYSSRLPPGDSYRSVSLIGSSGSIYSDDHHNLQLHYGGGSPIALRTGSGMVCFGQHVQEFVSAIEQERTPAVSCDDWLSAHSVLEGVKSSLKSAQPRTFNVKQS